MSQILFRHWECSVTQKDKNLYLVEPAVHSGPWGWVWALAEELSRSPYLLRSITGRPEPPPASLGSPFCTMLEGPKG